MNVYKGRAGCPLILISHWQAKLSAIEKDDYKGGILNKLEEREEGKKHLNYQIPF